MKLYLDLFKLLVRFKLCIQGFEFFKEAIEKNERYYYHLTDTLVKLIIQDFRNHNKNFSCNIKSKNTSP